MGALTPSILLLTTLVVFASGHVRLMQPVGRSSIFRDPQYSHWQPKENWNDDMLNCGAVHQPVIVNNCGVCGDPAAESRPRANENGGAYQRGVVATYRRGDIIDLKIEYTTAHLGYLEFHLCDQEVETEECFNSHKLELIPQGGIRLPIERNYDAFWINQSVKLPAGVHCSRCTLRMHYRNGNSWGEPCENGGAGMGCGIQETFRSCSDVEIL